MKNQKKTNWQVEKRGKGGKSKGKHKGARRNVKQELREWM